MRVIAVHISFHDTLSAWRDRYGSNVRRAMKLHFISFVAGHLRKAFAAEGLSDIAELNAALTAPRFDRQAVASKGAFCWRARSIPCLVVACACRGIGGGVYAGELCDCFKRSCD